MEKSLIESISSLFFNLSCRSYILGEESCKENIREKRELQEEENREKRSC